MKTAFCYKRSGDKHGRFPNKFLRIQEANSYTKNLKRTTFRRWLNTVTHVQLHPHGLEDRAAETIIAPEVETAATPEEKISTNKAYIIMLQDTKEE